MTKYLILTTAAFLLATLVNAPARAETAQLTDVNPVQLASAKPMAPVDDVAAAEALRAFLAAQRPIAPIAAPGMNAPRR